MASIKLKIYPSGFLGSADVASTEPLDIVAIKHRLFDNSALGNVSAHTANREVSSLWEDCIAGDPEYRSFDFRVKIINAALAAFGTVTFRDWVLAQSESPYHTEYQQRWIHETVDYVFNDKRRQFTYNVWFPLITTGHADRAGINTDLVKSVIGTGAPYEHLPLRDFIQMWVSRERGVDDLLESLNLLFGKR